MMGIEAEEADLIDHAGLVKYIKDFELATEGY